MTFSVNTNAGAMTALQYLTNTQAQLSVTQLQSLQVKQQLGIQALSIANQAPQTVLSLFR